MLYNLNLILLGEKNFFFAKVSASVTVGGGRSDSKTNSKTNEKSQSNTTNRFKYKKRRIRRRRIVHEE